MTKDIKIIIGYDAKKYLESRQKLNECLMRYKKSLNWRQRVLYQIRSWYCIRRHRKTFKRLNTFFLGK